MEASSFFRQAIVLKYDTPAAWSGSPRLPRTGKFGRRPDSVGILGMFDAKKAHTIRPTFLPTCGSWHTRSRR
jgi:hypothetical protein